MSRPSSTEAETREAVVRDLEGAPATNDESEAGLLIDVSRQRVVIDGSAVHLTFREFALLCFLVEREGMTLHRSEIASADNAFIGTVKTRTIDVHIKRLRRKLEPYGDVIRTQRGFGYRFDRRPQVRVTRSG
ncbi:winged helix-turn-helix domain-containing protein [Subtercola sp. PAMC28395]|uniref:winged helix-turn-helix domain-containing protein n=1 Tax=Subtercola sp. PAMC28395 TaxID=2846775 RepID=UPI001C0DAE04|nr:winged helix-turn-helix domain-containing protein [Subtercola sp. PAMC28395]QWT25145.1 winged helix-turn-helix domain-containing protein [Subtercola sp. PAMC28395]